MVQATTPTYILTFSDIDLTEAEEIYVTFRQGRRTLTISGEHLEVTATTITLTLEQEDTLMFEQGGAEVQVNMYYADGTRACSDIAKIQIERNLYPVVIEDE